jgi:hypothetical protein
VIQPVTGEQIFADPQDLGEARNWGSADVVRWVVVCPSMCVWAWGSVGALGGGAGLEMGVNGRCRRLESFEWVER